MSRKVRIRRFRRVRDVTLELGRVNVFLEVATRDRQRGLVLLDRARNEYIGTAVGRKERLVPAARPFLGAGRCGSSSRSWSASSSTRRAPTR